MQVVYLVLSGWCRFPSELINSERFSCFSPCVLMKMPHMNHAAGLWWGDLIGQVTPFYIPHFQTVLGAVSLRHTSVVRLHSNSAPRTQRSALLENKKYLSVVSCPSVQYLSLEPGHHVWCPSWFSSVYQRKFQYNTSKLWQDSFSPCVI
jgi:hypothetical protein